MGSNSERIAPISAHPIEQIDNRLLITQYRQEGMLIHMDRSARSGDGADEDEADEQCTDCMVLCCSGIGIHALIPARERILSRPVEAFEGDCVRLGTWMVDRDND